MAEPPWMAIARSQIGVKEIKGPKGSNPKIEGYLKVVGMAQDDDVPWCSAFANWCMKQAKIAGSGSGAARSWQHWGVESKPPVPGAITVFWRETPTSAKGHVAFYVSETKDFINVLGGNQHDEVSIAPYPRRRLLGYRWPSP